MAGAPSELDQILAELGKPARTSEADRRITLCKRALELVKPHEAPARWAALNADLAGNLITTPSGIRSANIEAAISVCTGALSRVDTSAAPFEWSVLQYNLGNAYLMRGTADRGQNLEHAIKAYENALTVMTSERMPVPWAAVLNSLAGAYQDRVRGSRAENLEKALALHTEALAAPSTGRVRALWAIHMAGLGRLYRDRLVGDQAGNIEKAIACYEDALTVFTRDGDPLEWARTMTGLGSAFLDRIRGDADDNALRALDANRQALSALSREKTPDDWALATGHMASALLSRSRGDRAENVESAIEAYNSAMTICTREDEPRAWARLANNLARAYADRERGDRSDNLEKAIELTKASSSILTPQDSPLEWARAMVSLASAYVGRLRGDVAGNLESAIHCCERALEVFTPETSPRDWLSAVATLGNAYIDRLVGDAADNIELAIAYYEKGFRFSSAKALPSEWAVTANGLAVAYQMRSRGTRAENQERAIHVLEKVLEILSSEAMPRQWAHAVHDLASLFEDRMTGDPSQNIERAIEFYRKALTVYEPGSTPIHWGGAMNNLAQAYRRRIEGTRAANIATSIELLMSVLEGVKPEVCPTLWRQSARNLGELYLEQERWQESVDVHRAALAVAERVYSTALLRTSKVAALSDIGKVGHGLAYGLARTNNPDGREAVMALERARARLLSEALGRDASDLAALQEVAPEVHERFRSAAERLTAGENAEIAAASSHKHGGWRESPELQMKDIEAARSEFDAALADIRRVHGFEDFISEPTWSDVSDAATSDCPIVYCSATPAGGLALLVYPDDVDIQWLDDIRTETLWTLLDRRAGSPRNGYLAGQLGDVESLGASLPIVLTRLGSSMRLVAERLRDRGARSAVLIAGGLLSLFPLHAACYDVGPRVMCLLDEFNVVYSPSARATSGARRAAKRNGRAPLQWVGIGNPTPTDMDLPHAETEVHGIDSLIRRAADARSTLLLNDDATIEALKRAISGTTVLHLACHARFDSSSALESFISLAQGTRLPLGSLITRDMQRAFGELRLVFLSACQTALTDGKAADEVIGLPAGFLQAGVPGVVGTLWPVHDDSTALLALRFYSYLLGTDSPSRLPRDGALAMRLAQLWVRDVTYQGLLDYLRKLAPTMAGKRLFHDEIERCSAAVRQGQGAARPYESPVYWAPFVYFGAPELALTAEDTIASSSLGATAHDHG